MKKNGFTMVELIVVVAIISILANIIIPKLSGARSTAQLKACIANEQNIALAMQMYANDNNNHYTPNLDPVNRVDYDLPYLVPGYIKAVINCNSGHSYRIASNYPAAGQTLIFAATGLQYHGSYVGAWAPQRLVDGGMYWPPK